MTEPLIERRAAVFPQPTLTRPIRRLRDLVDAEVLRAHVNYGANRPGAAEALGIALKTYYLHLHRLKLIQPRAKGTTG